MSTNEDFAAQADQARMAAFVAANRSTICTRCGTKDVLNKRGHCYSCDQKRIASMRADPVSLTERPVIKAATTIYSLLGNGDRPLVQGADLNHCSSAMSARANLDATIKSIGKYEAFLIMYPHSESGWQNYERMYERIEGFVQSIKTHEAAVKATHPELKTLPIQIPQRLERATRPEWLEV